VLALPFTAPMANDRAQAQIRAPTLLASWLTSLGRLGGSFAFHQDKDLARLDVVFFKDFGRGLGIDLDHRIWYFALDHGNCGQPIGNSHHESSP
jgi:hypothetical protein